ncbi:hypothetical protein ABL78_4843 [Leptomonas seymouri]|uniref:Uncharacterized protein n=1 Tax=Leptomonas seymouri TaxID=5684 RepID=A0A0N1IJW1_LEPSE|nr:hypothetical protein ABL78_4843 [Leptomonas seymouri]|eukprot:KPI86082.1 hypothetical protein ABL78_4843 [Leptomonas seymouri]
MDVFKPEHVPCLALIFGDEESLTSLHYHFAAFPRGVTYPQFRHILLPYLHSEPEADAEQETTIVLLPPLPGFPDAQQAPRPPVFTQDLSFPTPPIVARATPRGSFAGAVTSSPREDRAQEHQNANRGQARLRRVRTRHELAGLCAAPVDPIKQLFNRIDVENEQRVTWNNLLDYVVAEAATGAAEACYSTNRSTIYSFSRALRCSAKQRRPKARGPSSQHQQSGSARRPTEALTYKRFHLDLCGTQAAVPRTVTRNDSSGTIYIEDDLAIIRILDGLESHSSVFFVSSRSHPFLLYGKQSFERAFTAPPDMLDGSVPTAVSYLSDIDLFLCYSTDDRLLRGWYSLLAPSIATVAVSPLLVESFVRRMRTMPTNSPTYAEYSESVFLGDSHGHVMHITAPRGRGGGMEFVVQRTYKGLHSRSSGGLVDFCLYGSYLYSSGCDGRIVATSLITGQLSLVGSVEREHLHALVYIPEHNGLVAATTSTRRLLWWEAGSQGALPGVPFEPVGHGDHAAAIVAVVYVAESDYLASADCDGVVKVWEMATHRCVQSFQSSRMNDGGVSGSGGSEEVTPGSTLTSRGRMKRDTGAVNNSVSSAGRDMMMLTHNGLHSLLSESAGANQVGSAKCHSLAYCSQTEELMCGFANSITCRGLRSSKSPYMCDAEELCQDILYDARHQTFLLWSATRLSVWDGVHGGRRGVLDRTKLKNSSPTRAEIKAVCLDDLGSRIFLSAGDGNVYVYSTQTLLTNAANGVDESCLLWSDANFVTGANSKPTPAFVEQMYFSSILRIWVGITSGGMLLVRTDLGSQQTVPTATVSVSSCMLTHLRVSEELGLVAVVDSQHVVYLYDMEAWSDVPKTRSLAQYGRIVDLTFLDTAPVLVTVHVGGVCQCWSCPPAVECFEVLGTLYHPQFTPPLRNKKEGQGDASHPVDATASDCVSPLAKLPASTATTGDSTTSMTTRAAHPTLPHRTPDRPLTSTSRENRPLFIGVDTSRPGIAKSGAGERNDYKDAVEAGALGSVKEGHLSASGSHTWANNTVDLDNAHRTGSHDGQSPTLEALIVTPKAVAKSLSRAENDFTSVSYDGQSHHLFLGDAHGVVHIYRMCEILQRYKLPRCSYYARTAFSLFAKRLHQRICKGKDGGERDINDEPAVAVFHPVLLRSVDVHVCHRDRSVARKRSLSLAAATRLPHHEQQSKPKPRKHVAGGVVCVRWLASRGVLATSGNDHEVWLLNAEGDKLGFFSSERAPPQPKSTALSSSLLQQSKALGRESLAMSLISRKSAALDDALILQRPFFLPPAEPVEEYAHGSAAQPAGMPECCTHSNLTREALSKRASRFLQLPLDVYDDGALAVVATAPPADRADRHADEPHTLPSLPQLTSSDGSLPPRPTCSLADYLASPKFKASLEKMRTEWRVVQGGPNLTKNATSSSSSRLSSPLAAAFATSPRPHPPLEPGLSHSFSQRQSTANCGQEISYSYTSRNTIQSTQPNVGTPVSAAPSAELLDRETFLLNLNNEYVPVSPAQSAEVKKRACGASLVISGVTLQRPSTGPRLYEGFLHSSLKPEKCTFASSIRVLPRRERLALSSPLRPMTTGRVVSVGRVGEPEEDRFTQLSNEFLTRRMRSPPRHVATAPSAQTKGKAATCSLMLAYASAEEGSETLELYSRELRQRLRRPRLSN